MAFRVPINTVPPPPFTQGDVNSFNIRMSITDPSHKVSPSVIQVLVLVLISHAGVSTFLTADRGAN